MIENSLFVLPNWDDQPLTAMQATGEYLEQVQQKAAKSQKESERKVKELENERDDLKSQIRGLEVFNATQEKKLSRNRKD